MTTVVHMMGSSKIAPINEKPGKLPSFAVEADLFDNSNNNNNRGDSKTNGGSYEASPALTSSPGSSNQASDHETSRNIRSHVKETNEANRPSYTNPSDRSSNAQISSSWHQLEHMEEASPVSISKNPYLGGGGGGYPVRQTSFSAPSSPQTPLRQQYRYAESSESLQEIFQVDDLLSPPPSLLSVPSLGQSRQRSFSPGLPEMDHSDDGGSFLQDDMPVRNQQQHQQHQHDRHRASTPPHSVYATAYPSSGGASGGLRAGDLHNNNNNRDMTTPAGGEGNNSSNNNNHTHHNQNNNIRWEKETASLIDSGRSTPTNSVIASSVVSDSSGMTPGNSVRMRPLLYSAIGSLENANSATLGSFHRRAPSRDFCKLGGGGNVSLIPPQPNQQQQQQGYTSGVTINKNNKSRFSAPATIFGGSKGRVAHEPTESSHAKGGEGVSEISTKGSGSQQQNSIPETFKTEKDASSSSDAAGTATAPGTVRLSNLKTRRSRDKDSASSTGPRVSYDNEVLRKKKSPPKPVEMFRPSCDAYTPRMERKKIAYKPAEMRTPVQKMSTPMGTLQRPNFRDALRRVAMIIHQHIVKIEQRFDAGKNIRDGDEGLFKTSMKDTFNEENYVLPTYKCTMVRIPMARPGMVYGLRKIKANLTVPTEGEIYEFAHQLFKKVQLSSECSIVCLIYVERLMEAAKVPLLACTWRPIFMCGLLLASKVWQDLSSWNIEFASVYPQFPLDAINRLELNFLRHVKWDLYISSR
jgi:hypothetical protein